MTPHGNGLEDAGMSYSDSSSHLQAAQDTVLGACYVLGGDMMATASDTGAIQVSPICSTSLWSCGVAVLAKLYVAQQECLRLPQAVCLLCHPIASGDCLLCRCGQHARTGGVCCTQNR